MMDTFVKDREELERGSLKLDTALSTRTPARLPNAMMKRMSEQQRLEVAKAQAKNPRAQSAML